MLPTTESDSSFWKQNRLLAALLLSLTALNVVLNTISGLLTALMSASCPVASGGAVKQVLYWLVFA